MGAERTAIVLETLSFFLVTIDLIGETRLIALHRRTLTWGRSFRGKDISGFRKGVQERRHWPWVFVGILLVSAIIFAITTFPSEDVSASSISSFVGDVIGRVVGVAIVAVMLSSALLIWVDLPLIVAAFVVERLVYITINVLLFLLQRLHLSGIMLASGAVLFLISKLITFTASGAG